jgi:hypothetical protein
MILSDEILKFRGSTRDLESSTIGIGDRCRGKNEVLQLLLLHFPKKKRGIKRDEIGGNFDLQTALCAQNFKMDGYRAPEPEATHLEFSHLTMKITTKLVSLINSQFILVVTKVTTHTPVDFFSKMDASNSCESL